MTLPFPHVLLFVRYVFICGGTSPQSVTVPAVALRTIEVLDTLNMTWSVVELVTPRTAGMAVVRAVSLLAFTLRNASTHLIAPSTWT